MSDTKTITMANGWKIEAESSLVDEMRGRKLLFGPMNGMEDDQEEFEEGGEFLLYVSPDMGGGEVCDQHLPSLDAYLEPLIGHLGCVGSMECAHDIEHDKVAEALGTEEATFDEAYALVKRILIGAGLEEGDTD